MVFIKHYYKHVSIQFQENQDYTSSMTANNRTAAAMPKTKTDQALIERAQLARACRIEVLCRVVEGIIHKLPLAIIKD